MNSTWELIPFCAFLYSKPHGLRLNFASKLLLYLSLILVSYYHTIASQSLFNNNQYITIIKFRELPFLILYFYLYHYPKISLWVPALYKIKISLSFSIL